THLNTLHLNFNQLKDRLTRLTDAYLDRTIEKDIFDGRKTTLLLEIKGAEEKLREWKEETTSVPDRVAEFLELAGNVYLDYQMALPAEKRDLLKVVTSNRLVEAKNVS